MTVGRQPRWSKTATRHASIALVGFLIFIGLLAVMVWKAETLVALGLVGNYYYVLLVVLGLASAVVLFGVLNSYAEYSGKQLGGALQLGGPVVLCLLVPILSSWLVQSPNAFSITVFVHGPGGRHDLILRNHGHVIIDLGNDRRREAIGEKGDAHIQGIPSTLRGQEVAVSVDAEGVELARPNKMLRLDHQSIYLEVRRKPGRIAGRVQDQSGQPLKDVNVRLETASTNTDDAGRFAFTLQESWARSVLSLQAIALGYKTWSGYVAANANEAIIVLHREP